MMHAQVLKPSSLSTVLLQYRRPSGPGGPSAVQARDDFQKRLGFVWKLEVNGGPSGGEWQTVRRRKLWGHIFVQRLGVEGHDSRTVRP